MSLTQQFQKITARVRSTIVIEDADRRGLRWLCGLLFGALLLRLFFIGYFGDIDFEPDSYAHFLYSASAFARLPESLNWAAGVWPKPIFTLLTGSILWVSGIHALWIIKVFNTLLWCGIGWLAYRLARQLRLSVMAALSGVFLTMFSFLGFRGSIGTLTEPLFGLLVLAAFVAMYDRRYTLSCVLVSLSALTRSEGLFLIVVWVVILWGIHKRRRFSDLVVLAFFPFIWNLWGYALTGNPTFIISTGYPIISPYGHGEWLDFPLGLLQYEPIIFPLAVLGLMLTLRRKEYRPLHLIFMVYFGFNVVAWRYGLFGTAGILRYFVPIVPWLAIYAVAAIEYFGQLSAAYRRLTPFGLNPLFLQVPFTILVLVSNTAGYHLYNTPTVPQPLLKAGQWIKENRAADFVYASHPALLYYAGRDFYSGKIAYYPTDLHSGGIIAYDLDFGTQPMKQYIDNLPLLKKVGNFVFIYDHDLGSIEAEADMAFSSADIQPHLMSGWSGVEDWGTWAISESSEFAVYFPSRQSVTITVSAFPNLVKGRRQSIEVYYNDTTVGHYEFPENDPGAHQFSFSVPQTLVRNILDVIKFKYGYALSPQELGTSGDSRPLAVGFLELKVTP